MAHPGILQLIERFHELRIVVIGDIMLDIYDFCYSAASRPSPEKPGKPVYTAHRSFKSLGGAANVAANLAALDVSTALIGVTGNDGHFFTMRELANDASIEHRLIKDPTRQSTVKTRLYIDDEYALRRDDETAERVGEQTAQQILAAFHQELGNADAVIISDYNKGFFTPEISRTVIDACNQRTIPVIVDFKPPNRALFSGATLIAPNNLEAGMMIELFRREDRLEEAMHELYELLQCKNVIVTLGARGICGYDGREFFVHPANKVSEVDTVGCGDTVRAALAAAFALGGGLKIAARLANDAAAVVLQKKGTATVDRRELRTCIEQWGGVADARA
jgi:D-beta-D-heptose 7-phosphate kinase/D-beta-D-heptose 1-phosphate adenosyltransferase